MRNTKRFLCFLLVVCVFGATLGNEVVAQNKKRAGKTTKTSARANRKSTRVIPPSAVSSGVDVRAGSSGTSSDTTGTGTTTTVLANEATILDKLTVDLKTCITKDCEGDVEFEKCYRNGQIDVVIQSNSMCKKLYDAAPTDLIRLSAVTALEATLKGYFKDRCDAAGGTAAGWNCKFNICYYASGGTGDKAKTEEKCKDLKLNDTLICSPSYFGIDEKDLEYQEEMSGEAIGAIIESSMGMAQGLLQMGTSIYSQVKASKDLKGKNIIMGDIVYKFDGKTLSEEKICQKWTVMDNAKVVCTDPATATATATATPDGDNYYCKDPDPAAAADDVCAAVIAKKPVTAAAPPAAPYTQIDCGQLSAAEWSKQKDNGCLVRMRKATEVSVAKKQQELINKFGDLAGLKAKADREKWIQGVVSTSATESYLSTVNTGLNKMSGTGDGNFTNCVTNTISMGKDMNTSITNYNNGKDTDNKINAGKCKSVSGQLICVLMGEPNLNKCEFIGDAWMKPAAVAAVSEDMEFLLGDPTTDADGVITYNQNFAGATEKYYDTLSSDRFSKNTIAYESQVSAYNEAQKGINKHEAEVKELKEQKDAGVSGAISGGMVVLQHGSGMTSTLVAEGQKRERMTNGQCYIGSRKTPGAVPARPMISDGMSKKLVWKNL